MTNRCVVVALLTFATAAGAQAPEMARLSNALAGDWSSVEVLQYGKTVPQGSGRRGTDHVRVAAGGTVLVSEGHTVGAVGGDLHWVTSMWWDPSIARYRMLTCFKALDANGCELRGTLRWLGDTLVNEYKETVDGKLTRMRDLWTDITPTSHTLTEEHEGKPNVVSHDTYMP